MELLCGDVTDHWYPSPQQWFLFTFLFSNVTPGYVLIIDFIVYIAKYKWSFLFLKKKKDTCEVISSEKKKHLEDPMATWKGGPVAVFISHGFLIHCFPLSVDERIVYLVPQKNCSSIG